MSKKKAAKVVKGPKIKSRPKPTAIALLQGDKKKKGGIVSRVGKALS